MSHRMGKKFDPSHILREKDPWAVATNAFDVALEFALLGCIDTATELFLLYGSFKQGCKSSWSPGMYFAWEATGLWPDCIPAEERTSDALSRLESERGVWLRNQHASKEGLEKLIAMGTGEDKPISWGEPELKPDLLTAAIDTALFIGNKKRALEILQIFADNFELTWHDISRSRLVWGLLKDQALVKAIGVDEEKLAAFRTEVFGTFNDRLHQGAKRIYSDLSMKDLAEACSKNTIDNSCWEEMDVEDPDGPKPDSILCKGATKENIAALEKRLEHELPEDYKEFLEVTNGMGSYWNGFFGEPRLLGTEDIHVANFTEQQRTWLEAAVEMIYIPDLGVKVDYPPFTRVIQINAGNDESKYVVLQEPEFTKLLGGAWFAGYATLSKEKQEQVNELLGHFYRGKEAAMAGGWQVLVWDKKQLQLTVFSCFREFLEYIAVDSAKEDILEEEDDFGRYLHGHDIFSFALRKPPVVEDGERNWNALDDNDDYHQNTRSDAGELNSL